MLDKVTSKNLRRKGKKRKSKENRGKFNGKSIKEWDIDVNDRITLGHWEGDTIVSSRGKSKSCLITLVERVSRFTLAILVKNRTTKVINKNVSYYLSILPKNIVKTITFDRGKEFSNWQQLEKKLDVKIYFANPYSPWQRGTNENTNGLIREKFPKKFIFSKTNKNEVNKFILWGFLVICVSLFCKVLVQINSIFKFYHKMSNCCISILNGHCSFFCYIFNC